MALAYQYGIPKEKGNDHATADREIADSYDPENAFFVAGEFAAISEEDSNCASPRVKKFSSADDVPAGVIIKVGIDGKNVALCLSGRSVPVRVADSAHPKAGDELEMTPDGRVQTLAGGKFIGVCTKTGIVARDQTGQEKTSRSILMDFKL